MPVRTRLAPSPTGDPHLGSAYAALFNRAFAKRNGGQFILRIEDTDRTRNSVESEAAIFDALRWLGLDWDEGPDVGGDKGPYRQSERTAIYKEYIAKLISVGGAFHCFCSKERLDELRRDQMQRGATPKYDGKCLALDSGEIDERIARGDSHVIRLGVPDKGECRFVDGVRGEITIPWSQVDMQVLIKSDGFPTYHFASTVDDHLMGISHIFRGEEWISSFPKHQLIYRYFGWDMPLHYHLPLLRNPDQSKMSKRRNATSINYYRRCGFLRESLLNYLATMGWSMPEEREKFSMEEFYGEFNPERLSPRGPVFDIEKLSWLNGLYIRELTSEELKERVFDWAFGGNRLDRLLSLVRERSERFDDLFRQADYILGDRIELKEEDFEHRNLELDEIRKILHFVNKSLEELEEWNRDNLYESLNLLSKSMSLKFRDFLGPIFVAVSGRTVTLPLFDSLELLERDVVKMRIRSAIDVLGGISKKESKRLDREWRDLVSTQSS
ncbi:MAG: glutamate--tRNA ligase [Gammaproteobacteria bacterium]|nr:glutamate--tRNA ligase [Gammaproteobacteria bacterium]